MKKLIVFICLASSALSLHARGIQEDFRLAEEQARISYALGIVMGESLRAFDLEINYSAFTQGLRAALGNAIPQMSEQEAFEIIDAALQESMERRTAEYRRREIEFLARNRQREGVNVTPSGLQYVIIEKTEGNRPTHNSVVRVHYEGTFIDGTVFDSSGDEGVYIPLGMVIPGWTEGVMLMSPGSKYRFYIPSELAYGRSGIQSVIPPYATLIFTVELLEIIEENELMGMLENDDYFDAYDYYRGYEE